jgi:uncharacterized membrane protein YtjA (UPF0391 family)
MLKLALFFFVISIVAAVFGYSGISSVAGGLARILFFIALAIFVVCLILGLTLLKAIA